MWGVAGSFGLQADFKTPTVGQLFNVPIKVVHINTNGAKSRGPITPAGKKRSARNSTRHGLLSVAIVPEGEFEELFRHHLASFREEFDPQDALERAIVERMAVARWRQLRVWSLESAVISSTVDELNINNPAVAEVAAQRSALCLCLRYDARFERQYDQALKRLERIRSSDFRFPAKQTQHFVDNKALTCSAEHAERHNNGFVSALEATEATPRQLPGSGVTAAIGARPASR